jgi:4-hydroxy-tetrahydrodipicolinate reductase
VNIVIKVAVTGAAGRMGTLIIDNVLKASDLKLVGAFDIKNIGKQVGDVKIMDVKYLDAALRELKPDVLIDFTVASGAVENVKIAARNKVNLVVGTTGFTDEQRKEMEQAIGKNVAAVISSNFSVGVNVFWKILEFAAVYLKDFDIEIIEAHHRFKKDAPSGTAKTSAEIILKALKKELAFTYGREGLKERGAEIGLHAIRAGDIVGEHTVLFAGDGERIEITHRAHSRQAFASGALKAARWVVTAEKGLHSYSKVLGL